MEYSEDKNILIIEDDMNMAKTIANIFNKNKQLKIHIAYSGSIGIQKAFQLIPNIIICNINILDIDGFQIFKTLKESSITSMIPFIFLSDKSDIDEIRMGMQLGADDFIIKPFQNKELLISIKARLKKYDNILAQSTSNFNKLLALSPDPVFIHNKINFTKINSLFTKVLGYSMKDLSKKSILDITHNDNKNELMDNLTKTFSGLYNKFDCNIIFIHKNGDNIQTKLSCKSSKNIKGDYILIGCATKLKATDNNNQEKFISSLKTKKDYISYNIEKELKKIPNNDEKNLKNIKLSMREKDVLYLSCKGLQIKQIANLLDISTRTVEKYRTSLMQKTKTNNIIELIIYSIKNKIIKI